MNPHKTPDYQSASGANRIEFKAPPPPAAPPPSPSPGRGLGSTLGGVALVGALAVTLLYGGSLINAFRQPLAVTETWSQAYRLHRLAKAGTPIALTKEDLDVQATRAAIAAARDNRPIPRLTGVSDVFLEALRRGEAEIYTVRAYDTCREDGDWITIEAPNLSRQGSLPILNAGTSISVPVIKGQSGEIVLHADRDGVGGVTVGLQSSQGLWYSKVLDVGAVQRIPIVIR